MTNARSAGCAPLPSPPNPHPTPLTPRTPRGECAPRQRDGFSGSRNGMADLPPYHPPPWLYGQSGCGHFIKSPPIICRLPHRQSAERLEADTRGARGPLASPALPLVNWGAGIAPLAPLHRAGIWLCLRRMRAFICWGAEVAVPSSSVCLSSFVWPVVQFASSH